MPRLVPDSLIRARPADGSTSSTCSWDVGSEMLGKAFSQPSEMGRTMGLGGTRFGGGGGLREGLAGLVSCFGAPSLNPKGWAVAASRAVAPQ